MNEQREEETLLAKLRQDFSEKHRAAEQAAYKLACELPVGRDRERAFDIYENIRLATRIA